MYLSCALLYVRMCLYVCVYMYINVHAFICIHIHEVFLDVQYQTTSEYTYSMSMKKKSDKNWA